MTLELHLVDEFGSFCADGEKGAAFRLSKIDPFIDVHEKIVFDLAGVRNMNSSFANALFAGMVIYHSPSVLSKMCFARCNPIVKVAIQSALALGVERHQQEHGTAPTPA